MTELVKPDELLMRQVHPDFFADGQITSQAFLLKPDDKGKLSVYLRSLITPEESWWHYINQGFSSAGVWGVTQSECLELSLSGFYDPIPGNRAHGYIDLEQLTGNQARSKAKLLKRKAQARGALYRPTMTTSK